MRGFYINRLFVSGKNLTPAIVIFTKGANLITGASDTGKSYIFSALEYVLGGSEPPKDILESKGYTDIFIEITTYEDEKKYTLFRKIGQSKIEIKETSVERFQTSDSGYKKYTTTGTVNNTEHISSFLLSLCGLGDRKILKNKTSGTTQNLSFKPLRQLTFIDEISIIKTTSPFYFSNQYFDQILAQSLLSLLLTGVDYSDTVEKEDKKSKETRLNGKLEFLSFQISQLALEKDETINKSNKISISASEKYFTLDSELQKNLTEAKEITKEKNQIIKERQIISDKILYNRDLLHRFGILEKQYRVDVERLDFILETDVLSSQIGDVVCPICSSPIQDNHVVHIVERTEFREAAIRELSKNQSKLVGLKDTISSLEIEQEALLEELKVANENLEKLETYLNNNFSPKINELRLNLREFLDFEKLMNTISFIEDQISKLYKEKERIEKLLNTKEESEDINLLPYSLISELSNKIEDRLKNWNYEQFIKVDFDSNYRVFDIVISGKSRKSYGKGKRSISYAACLFGLLDYCCSNERGFTNLLVLDSPLTTFEEKRKQADVADILQTEILKSFFLDLINLPESSQVIIFDNKEPDSETLTKIATKVNVEVFTGNPQTGRYGFFPV